MPNSQLDQDTAKGATEVEDHKIPGNIGLQSNSGTVIRIPCSKTPTLTFPSQG